MQDEIIEDLKAKYYQMVDSDENKKKIESAKVEIMQQ